MRSILLSIVFIFLIVGVVPQAASTTNCAGTGGSAGNVNTSADSCSSTGVAATCFPGNAQINHPKLIISNITIVTINLYPHAAP